MWTALLLLAVIGGALSASSVGLPLVEPSTYSPRHWPGLLVTRQSWAAAESARTGTEKAQTQSNNGPMWQSCRIIDGALLKNGVDRSITGIIKHSTKQVSQFS